MAEYLTKEQLYQTFFSGKKFKFDEFQITKSLAYYYNINPHENNDLILLALNSIDNFSFTKPIINDLAREVGLFPYLDPKELSLEDLLAYEFHRPEGNGIDNFVFHKAQSEIYYNILKGQNVILSAPTSFGKSLVIDAVIAIKKFSNIVIIVPTIALIDETRKRLSKFKESYKVITHATQELANNNIFVLTQERVIELIPDDLRIDFFVIDEFYKIGITKSDIKRATILNHAFYKLLNKGAQFYLLGPNIENINNSYFPKNIRYNYIRTDYNTVLNRRIRVKSENSSEEELVRLCKEIAGQTLIYCKSPNSINNLANLLYSSEVGSKSKEVSEMSKWIRDEFHPDWYLADYLDFGIGVHHGRLPRSVSQYILDAFNKEHIKFLLCTSTIIEGVNTKAKNVIIYDNKVAQDKFDFFTYNNICGRSGRMFQHFIGNVYLFHDAPIAELPLVDFPLFTQSEDTPSSLLLQMDETDLTNQSKERIDKIKKDSILDISTLRENSSIEPEYQNSIAKEIISNRDYLQWSYKPSYEELLVVCNLIWNHFVLPSNSKGYIYSAKQLTFKINRVMKHPDIRTLIAIEVGDKFEKDEINKSIESEINFIKYWPQYHFPNYLRSLDSIAKDILIKNNYKNGDFTYLALQLECLFNHPFFNVLEEYGLPFQTSRKIRRILNLDSSLDDLFSSIKKINTENIGLDDFEINMINQLKEQV